MNELINEKVSALLYYDRMSGMVTPRTIKWQGRIYNIKKLAYHHKVREGRNIVHIFHVTDGNTDFKLRLDTENLHWTLVEVTDGTTT